MVYLWGLRNPKRSRKAEKNMKELNSTTQRTSNSAIAGKSNFFFNAVLMLRSRRESNPHLRFRKPLFYPLNYGNLWKDEGRRMKYENPAAFAEPTASQGNLL